MCKHRTAYFLEKRKGLSLLVCTTGCGQPFWKDETGREVVGEELIQRLESRPTKRAVDVARAEPFENEELGDLGAWGFVARNLPRSPRN